MSVAPEIARLAGAVLLAPPQPAGAPDSPGGPENHGGHDRHGSRQEAAATNARMTLGTLARELRAIAATPERWWSLVRFDQDRSVTIMVEERASYSAWLVVLPPGDAGQACDCEAVTMIAGEATEGTGSSDGAILRPGPVRVHGGRHTLRGQGAGYSVSLHARANPQR
jgi:hypothetical protein